VLTRPAVEAGERLGFLPGDLAQKVDPYLRPLYDALYDLMGFDKVAKLFERGCIEIAPLAFMRGRTLNAGLHHPRRGAEHHAEQMKMFLTRIGIGSRAVVTGDVTQVDLPAARRAAWSRPRAGAAPTCAASPSPTFLAEDVVRHPLVARIVDAYTKNAHARLPSTQQAQQQ
jgi:phosphate starvation-inducible PhoH-like protein